MSTVHQISFEELAGNLAAILNKVRDEHTTIVVKYASGEKLLIKPISPTRQDAPKTRLTPHSSSQRSRDSIQEK